VKPVYNAPGQAITADLSFSLSSAGSIARENYDPQLVKTHIVCTIGADGIVMVVRALVTRRFDAERSQELLKALETPVLGVIINGIGPGQGGYGGYGHPYGYGTYGRGSSSGKDEDAVHGRLSERAGVRRELPGVGLGSMNGHPHLDS